MSSSFKLDPEMPMTEAVRRVACAELDSAYADLSSPTDRHRGVHEARKSLKKLRSLLVLLRHGLPEPAFLILTDRLRRIAWGLASARDAHALLDAVDKFEGEAEGDGERNLILALRDWLQRRREAAGRSLEGNMASDAMGDLHALRPAMSSLAVYPDGFHPVAKGLQDSYRTARKAFARAFASDDDDDFHDWRKTVQRHWRQMQLLSPCWPSELSTRVELSRSLSQILGDDHDIASLQQLVSAPTMMFASPAETAAFRKLCRRRQKELRRDARMRGARLFAERPRPFVERIEVYWAAAAARGDETGRSKTRTDNVVAFGEMGTTGRARASG